MGDLQALSSGLPTHSLHRPGVVDMSHAHPGNGLFMGAALFVVLRAFASGGAAVTGVEAISNGVPAFREPAWRNARTTLVWMGSLLGAMFLGLSILAGATHAAPFEKGTPTVISQVGKLVYGTGFAGHILFYLLQAGTMLILVLAANTSFADFPRLASFAAADGFMPRQLTKRGHRLVFSNGILSLAAVATVLVIVTEAKVSRLIPLYAIGVFTSFTLSQAGMAKHHWTRREPGWRRGLFINGMGAVLSLVVDVIIAVTKFAEGGWVIIVAVPLLVLVLLRLNRQYVEETAELREDAPKAAAAPILRRHVVLVLVDQLDLAAARAIHYARTLTPDELRAVHFAVDTSVAAELRQAWTELGLSRVPLDIIECPDRRLTRAAVDLVAEALSRRRHRGHGAAAPARVRPVLAPPAARPHRVGHRLGPGRRAARQRDAHPLPPAGQPPDRGHQVQAGQAAPQSRRHPPAMPASLVIPSGCVRIGDLHHRDRVRWPDGFARSASSPGPESPPCR